MNCIKFKLNTNQSSSQTLFRGISIELTINWDFIEKIHRMSGKIIKYISNENICYLFIRKIGK